MCIELFSKDFWKNTTKWTMIVSSVETTKVACTTEVVLSPTWLAVAWPVCSDNVSGQVLLLCWCLVTIITGQGGVTQYYTTRFTTIKSAWSSHYHFTIFTGNTETTICLSVCLWLAISARLLPLHTAHSIVTHTAHCGVMAADSVGGGRTLYYSNTNT